MAPLPTALIPHCLREKLGVPNHADDWDAHGSVTRKGLRISGTYSYPSFHVSNQVSRWGGGYSRTWTAVRLARYCGWVLPLKASTPPGIVAEYLADEGQEETNLYRLLMWFHWLKH